jgi:hypothetical protein
MKFSPDTIKPFAPYIKPIKLLEEAFRLAGLEVEYTATYSGWGKYKSLSVSYYPVLPGDGSRIIGLESTSIAEIISLTASLTTLPGFAPPRVFERLKVLRGHDGGGQ